MSTAAQITANQLNATHSTGPRTEQGKATVSQNSTTHGLTSNTVLSYESLDEFNHLVFTINEEFQPQTESGYYLVRQMAQARWRIHRINRLINATFDSLIGTADPDCPDVRLAQAMSQLGGDPIAKLQRYLNDAERSYYKARHELESAPKTAPTPKNEAKPMKPAIRPEPQALSDSAMEIEAILAQFTLPARSKPNSAAGPEFLPR